MTERQPIRVCVEFDSVSDPIAGRLRAEHGDRVSFRGWLGLLSALGTLEPSDRQEPAPGLPAPPPAMPDRGRST